MCKPRLQAVSTNTWLPAARYLAAIARIYLNLTSSLDLSPPRIEDRNTWPVRNVLHVTQEASFLRVSIAFADRDQWPEASR
jgi:hypothetical protein